MSEELNRAFSDGRTSEDIIKMIKATADEKEGLAKMVPGLAGALFKHVFTDKANPKLSALETYAPVLRHVATTIPSQVQVLVAAHTAWFNVVVFIAHKLHQERFTLDITQTHAH